MNPNIFRQYDIRGVPGKDFTDEDAFVLGIAFAEYISENTNARPPRIVVGKDNRISGPGLENAFISGLVCGRAEVTKVDYSTSPMIYWAVCTGNFSAGVNITASHNTSHFNGFKLVGPHAKSICGNQIQDLYHRCLSIGPKKIAPYDDDEYSPVYSGLFQNAYQSDLRSRITLRRPFRIVMDSANGVAGMIYPDLFRKMGCEVIDLYSESDGRFPNHEPDPIVEDNLSDLKNRVREIHADIGIAFDGDGDRFAIVDELGQFHDANETFVLLLRDQLMRHPKAPVVYTVSCSYIVEEEIRRLGGKPVMIPVGHSFVERAMEEHQAILGGEQSGHYFVPENYFRFDDAAYASAKLLEYLSSHSDSVSEQYSTVPKRFSSPELRPVVEDDQKFMVVSEVTRALAKNYPVNCMDGVRAEINDGWLGIRASNTSPCISILYEARSDSGHQHIKQILDTLLGEFLKNAEP